MRQVRLLAIYGIMATAPAAFAQRWEVGGAFGGGFYTSSDVSSPAGSAAAKLKTNVAASAWLGNNNHSRLGGELRYDYQRGDLQLKQGSTEATFGAQTHAVHYDFLYHFADSEARVRPFVAAGGGVKIYNGTGTESVAQPLSKIALLTKAQDLTALVSVGAGFKMHLSEHVILRLEIHDYLTPFPKEVIAPALGASAGGWLNDIVPMIGLSFTN